MAKRENPVNTERRSRPEGFHSARVNKGHPRRQARRDRALDRLETSNSLAPNKTPPRKFGPPRVMLDYDQSNDPIN